MIVAKLNGPFALVVDKAPNPEIVRAPETRGLVFIMPLDIVHGEIIALTWLINIDIRFMVAGFIKAN